MKEATQERVDNRIRDLATGTIKEFDSINLAKKASTALQKSGEIVRVIDTRKAQVVTPRAKTPKKRFFT